MPTLPPQRHPAGSVGAPLDVRNDVSAPLASLSAVREWARSYIAAKPGPDFHVGPDDDHQLQRWFILPRNPFNNVYLHQFMRSDDDRALHDHPWDNKSWVIDGEYIEHLQDGSSIRRYAGAVIERHAIEAHRIELVAGPVITLFFTGPVIRSWGFYCPQGWKLWRDFVDTTEGGNHRGQGCGE